MSEKNHNFGDLVCIYAQLLPMIRESAKGLGYALAIHGSMRRDLDIIAVPWVEDAAAPEELVQAIAVAVDGFVIGAKDEQLERGTVEPGSPHPHGRMVWNICWGGRPFIDLGIMPRSASDARVKELEAELVTWKARAGEKWSQHDLDRGKKVGELTHDLFTAYAERDTLAARLAKAVELLRPFAEINSPQWHLHEQCRAAAAFIASEAAK